MMGFFRKLIGASAEPADRKQRMEDAIWKFRLEVKNQERFFRQYLQQAVSARRSDDRSALAQAKKMMAFSRAYHDRLQRGLRALEVFSIMVDQMDAYRAFCSGMSEASQAIGEAFQDIQMAKVQQQFMAGLEKAETMQEMMDQLIEGFEQRANIGAEEGLGTPAGAEKELDELIETAHRSAGGVTEEELSLLLSRCPPPSRG